MLRLVELNCGILESLNRREGRLSLCELSEKLLDWTTRRVNEDAAPRKTPVREMTCFELLIHARARSAFRQYPPAINDRDTTCEGRRKNRRHRSNAFK